MSAQKQESRILPRQESLFFLTQTGTRGSVIKLENVQGAKRLRDSPRRHGRSFWDRRGLLCVVPSALTDTWREREFHRVAKLIDFI